MVSGNINPDLFHVLTRYLWHHTCIWGMNVSVWGCEQLKNVKKSSKDTGFIFFEVHLDDFPVEV